MMLKKNNRKYYEKPRINEVKLEIEEAVLVACKTVSGGSDGKKPGPGCGIGACSTTLGS